MKWYWWALIIAVIILIVWGGRRIYLNSQKTSAGTGASVSIAGNTVSTGLTRS